MWDEDIGAPPVIANISSYNVQGGGGFCVGRGRGFGNLSSLNNALPTLGSQANNQNNGDDWVEDSGWVENDNSNQNKSYNNHSYSNSYDNFSNGDNSYRPKNNDRANFRYGKPGRVDRGGPQASFSFTSSKRGQGCFKCGEDGHMSRDCPSGGGGGKGRACFKCNEEGHLSRDCPNENKNGRGRGCFRCGEEGHMSRDCTKEGNNRSRACHKCGEEGHMSRECPQGGGGGSRACHKCGEEGHMSRECPQGGGGGGGGSRACFKCGEEGHMSRECPRGGGGGGSRACFKCGEEGHMSRECPQGGGGGGGSRACHKCGEEGHMSRECPQGGGGGGSRACFKCGEEGHMSRECPSEGDRKSRGCFKCGEEGHMSRECPNPEKNVGPDGKPRAPLYIPPEPSDDAETVFASVPAGINFSKYESTPVDVSGSDPKEAINSFQAARLNSHLLNNIMKSGYEVPTPIQKHAIPVIMKGKDLMGCAQTGSGKTAAFLLPIINSLLTDSNLPNNVDKEEQEPLVLIVAPTRELALQIMSEAKKFAHDSIVRAEVVYGGTSTGYQIGRLKRGVHILVATPGRLNDLVDKGKVSFSQLRYLVLDEADRMLDMGFMPAIQKMVTTMPEKGKRRTLMFSATFPEEIQRIAAEFLDSDYVFITVGKVGGANTDVEQTFFKLGQYEKREKLMDILNESGTDRVLVFVEQKRTADFLASFTSQKDIPTTSIHGDRLQREREEALTDFRRGRMPVLVATAVAARGLDIKDVRHVINYDLPKSIDEYVHRIGRTGRVGNLGKATSFYDADVDQPLARSLKKILMDAQQVIPDWLHQEADNAVGTVPQYGRGNFGGRDFRNKGPPRNAQAADEAWDGNFSQNEAASCSQPVKTDEFWD